jgi:hypothetical protein
MTTVSNIIGYLASGLLPRLQPLIMVVIIKLLGPLIL